MLEGLNSRGSEVISIRKTRLIDSETRSKMGVCMQGVILIAKPDNDSLLGN